MTMKMTARIVAAYLRANPLPTQDIPALIADVYRALRQLSEPTPIAVAPVPAISPARSVTAQYIVCLECGARQKTLKRHLRTAHGLEPDEYRARWGLRPDYPMAAPDYAKRRSLLAQESGLGRKPAAAPAETEAETAADGDAAQQGFQYPASRWARPND